MAALTSGTLSEISRVSRVVVSMSRGREVGVARQQQHVVVGQAQGGELLGELHAGILPAAGRPRAPPGTRAACAGSGQAGSGLSSRTGSAR